jgi:tetratricopeptide (TPR) repeat protein
MAILVGFGVEHHEALAILDALGAAALRIAEPVESLSPDKREMVRLFGKATFLTAERKFDESFPLFEQLESKYRGQPNVAYVFGLALLVQKDPDKALTYFKTELEMDPNHVSALLQVASRMLEINQLEQCGEYARRVMELEPENYAGYYLAGRIHLYSREFPEAITLLEKSASLAPDLAIIQYSLYEAYHRAGRQEEASKARDRFLRLDAVEKRQRGEESSLTESPFSLENQKAEPERKLGK